MATKPESKIQKKIQEAIRAKYPDSFFFKTHGGPYQAAGIPDLVGVINGYFIGLEVKQPEKLATVTKLQADCIRKINTAGGGATVVTSPDEALAFIELFLKG